MPYLKDWAFGRSKGCGQCGWRGDRPPDSPGEGETATGIGFATGTRGVGADSGGGAVSGVGGGSEGKLVAAIVATVGDVGICGDRVGWNVHEPADS